MGYNSIFHRLSFEPLFLEPTGEGEQEERRGKTCKTGRTQTQEGTDIQCTNNTETQHAANRAARTKTDTDRVTWTDTNMYTDND